MYSSKIIFSLAYCNYQFHLTKSVDCIARSFDNNQLTFYKLRITNVIFSKPGGRTWIVLWSRAFERIFSGSERAPVFPRALFTYSGKCDFLVRLCSGWFFPFWEQAGSLIYFRAVIGPPALSFVAGFREMASAKNFAIISFLAWNMSALFMECHLCV